MGLHAYADGEWDEEHVIAFRWVKDEVLWHGNEMWNVTMLLHVMKQKQVLGKEIAISPSGENQQASTKHKTRKKQRTFR